MKNADGIIRNRYANASNKLLKTIDIKFKSFNNSLAFPNISINRIIVLHTMNSMASNLLFEKYKNGIVKNNKKTSQNKFLFIMFSQVPSESRD